MCQEMGRKRGQVTCSAECYKMYIESKDSKKIAEFVKSQTEPEK